MKSIKNLYFFIVVLYSGLALSIFRSQEGLILLFVIGLFIFYKETLRPRVALIFALGIWLIYFVINTFTIGSFHPFFMATYIIYIFIAHWLITYYRQSIFLKFENTIYFLTIISLAFYAIQLIYPTGLFGLIKALDLSDNLFSERYYASIAFYTFHQNELIEAFPRNAGFTWEPGPFACYLMLALFINIARHGAKFNDLTRLSVFLVALLTTQSSTGMAVLLAILIWYAWSRFKSISIRLIAIPIVLVLTVSIFISVPWLKDKIITESQQDIEEVIAHAELSGKSYNPGRFASFQLRLQDFSNYPIAGFGGNTLLQSGYLGEGNVVSAVSGIGNIIGKYGSFGLFVFIICIIATGKWLSMYYSYSGHFIFPVIMLIISFGFGIVESPLIITLWLVPLFLSKYGFKQTFNRT